MEQLGKLILLEGVSKCGKTSFYERNRDRLNATYIHPFDGLVGEEMRRIYATDKNFTRSHDYVYTCIGRHFAAMERAIEIVRAGGNVVLDRTLATTAAYNVDDGLRNTIQFERLWEVYCDSWSLTTVKANTSMIVFHVEQPVDRIVEVDSNWKHRADVSLYYAERMRLTKIIVNAAMSISNVDIDCWDFLEGRGWV